MRELNRIEDAHMGDARQRGLGLIIAIAAVVGCTSTSNPETLRAGLARPTPTASPARATESAVGSIRIKGTRTPATEPSPPPSEHTKLATEREGPSASIQVAAKASPDAIPAGWTECKAANGTFRIAFPLPPRRVELPSQWLEDGELLLTVAFVASDATHHRLFLAGSSDAPAAVTSADAETTKDMFRRRLETLSNGDGMTTSDIRPVASGAHMGWEARVQTGRMAGRCRGFLVGHRWILVSVFAPVEDLDAPTNAQFLDSLRLPEPWSAALEFVTTEFVERRPIADRFWKDFTHGDESFHMSFPGSPSVSDHKTITFHGETVPYQQVFITEGGLLYANYFDSAAGTAAPRVEDFATGAQNRGRLEDLRWIVVDGVRARQAVIALDDGRREITRVFVIGTRVYFLGAIGFKNVAGSTDAARFLNSFKLTDV